LYILIPLPIPDNTKGMFQESKSDICNKEAFLTPSFSQKNLYINSKKYTENIFWIGSLLPGIQNKTRILHFFSLQRIIFSIYIRNKNPNLQFGTKTMQENKETFRKGEG